MEVQEQISQARQQIERIEGNIQAFVLMNEERNRENKQRDEILNSLHTIIKGDKNINHVGVLERLEIIECVLKNFTEMMASAKSIIKFVGWVLIGGVGAVSTVVYFMWAILDHLKK